jgi:hypothetical protein
LARDSLLLLLDSDRCFSFLASFFFFVSFAQVSPFQVSFLPQRGFVVRFWHVPSSPRNCPDLQSPVVEPGHRPSMR